ncbi:MAG TPA: CBS domain-containing protein [Saprospiraceae bacterium]|nr:CBS domain-containing protein [Saprospiraceae bacterium]
MNPETTVSQIMTKRLVTVETDVRLQKIRQIFEEYGFHHIPVLEFGKLVGIISKTDFYRISHTLSFTLDGRERVDCDDHVYTAKDIMTEYPMQLDPDDTVGLAADIFLANRFHALPVVDSGDLVGIVTSHDLISYAYGPSVSDDVLVEDFSDI